MPARTWAVALLLAAGIAGADPPARTDTAAKAPAPATGESPPAPPSAAPAASPKPDDSAAHPGDLSPAPPEMEEGFGMALIRMVVVLAVVLALVYLTLNVGLRRLMGVRAGGTGGGPVELLQRIPLDPKKSMFVLKAAGEYLLVGGGDGSLSLICKLDAAEVERLEKERAAPRPGSSPFLQKLLSGRRGAAPPERLG